MIENNVNAIGADTLLVDDVYWWIESVNHGLPNTNISSNSIEISWNNVSYEKGYRIYNNTTNDLSSAVSRKINTVDETYGI